MRAGVNGKGAEGFSWIELLLVVAVLLVAESFLLPAFWFDGQRLS